METSKTYIIGNWKMNGDKALAERLAMAAMALPPKSHVQVVLCPPAIFMGELANLVDVTRIGLGGQDCHMQAEGAFTGDVSASMLYESGACYVLVGHSERRCGHGETNQIVAQKALQAANAELIPVICIGETAEQRKSGLANVVIEQQLAESIPEELAAGKFLLAYEPVWAIGSGQSATTDDIEAMHRHIITVVGKQKGAAANDVAVLYGGSVKAENAGEILTINGVSGVLVGGASLDPDAFSDIVAAAT